ncbi:apoptosis-inducing factor 1, mitochondrial [Tetranychus urticae]|uniref:FAD/NAD(P)-binding domain-containing protein n=1 Tax=Tetranychus urticae TaxID=32264 RepID=T1KHA7_TETUR|nr:apoptosis-inducing factor 1, mitochondrial [Tetranychus urticae]
MSCLLFNRSFLVRRESMKFCEYVIKSKSYVNVSKRCYTLKTPVTLLTSNVNLRSGLRKAIHNQRRFSSSTSSSSSSSLNKILIGGGCLVVIGSIVYFSSQSTPEKPKEKKDDQKPKVPKEKPKIENLPDSIDYLLIGGGTTAFSAFRSIRANDPKAKVLVISEEKYNPYMSPPLSKELWFSERELSDKLSFRQWNGRERSIFFEHPEYYADLKTLIESETGGVSLVNGYKVVELSPSEKRAYLDNGQSIGYKKCLIATGGRPKNLELFEKAPENVKERVLLYRSVDDFLKLRNICDSKKSVTIIGGGLLGSELACALGRRSQVLKSPTQVNQIFPEAGNVGKLLPEYLSQWTSERIKSEGVNIIPKTELVGARLQNDKLLLELNNGSTLETDYAVVAVGLQANTELAKSAGLEVDEVQGGYLVNSELQARSDIWVAGDASCFYDMKLGRRRVEHHDHAIISGRLAGENMTGAGKPYRHQSMFWSDLGPDIGFEAIGLVNSSLPTVGVFSKNEKSPESEDKSVETDKPRAPQSGDEFSKGLIFYLKDDVIVGIVLWNVFERISIARRIISEGKPYEDLVDVAKLFNLEDRPAEIEADQDAEKAKTEDKE